MGLLEYNKRAQLAKISTKKIESRYQTKTTPQLEIVKMLNMKEPIKDILKKFKDIKWVVMDNSVYDITGYEHPGG
jgi:cytochrome b involved in lipid metabolism